MRTSNKSREARAVNGCSSHSVLEIFPPPLLLSQRKEYVDMRLAIDQRENVLV
jgi:hypothetical protein